MLAGELWDAAMCWLKPEAAEGRRIVDKVVLHQLYQVITPRRSGVGYSSPAVQTAGGRAPTRELYGCRTSTPTGINTCPAGGSKDQRNNEGQARPTLRGCPWPGPGLPSPQYWGQLRPWEPIPRSNRPLPETKTPRQSGEREGLREGSTPGPLPKETIKSGIDRGKGPCYSCGQMGHFRRDCPFMEFDLAGESSSKDQTSARRHLPLIAKVGFGARELNALLDSGSAISMIRSHLVPADLPPLRWTMVVCLHHHTWQLPVVSIRLRYSGGTHPVEAVRVEDLPFPILLGRDAQVPPPPGIHVIGQHGVVPPCRGRGSGRRAVCHQRTRG